MPGGAKPFSVHSSNQGPRNKPRTQNRYQGERQRLSDQNHRKFKQQDAQTVDKYRSERTQRWRAQGYRPQNPSTTSSGQNNNRNRQNKYNGAEPSGPAYELAIAKRGAQIVMASDMQSFDDLETLLEFVNSNTYKFDMQNICICLKKIKSLEWQISSGNKRALHVVHQQLDKRVLYLLPAADKEQIKVYLHALVKIQRRNRQILGTISARLLSQGRELTSEDAARCAWCYASLGQPDGPLLRQLGTIFTQKMTRSRPQDCAMMLWSFATLKIFNLKVVKLIADYLTTSTQRCAPVHCSTALWSCATLGYYDPPFYHELLLRFSSALDGASAQSMSLVLWTVGSMRVVAPAIFRDILVECITREVHFNLEQYTSSQYAPLMPRDGPAPAANPNSRKWRQAEKRQNRRLEASNATDWSQMIYACGLTGHTRQRQVDALCAGFGVRVVEADAKSCANVLWAVATLCGKGGGGGGAGGGTAPQLISTAGRLAPSRGGIERDRGEVYVVNTTFRDDVLRRFVAISGDAPVQSIALVIWACATIGTPSKDIVSQLLRLFIRQVSFAPIHLVSSVMWSAAKMGVHEPVLTSYALRAVTPKLTQFSAQSVANIAWALGKLVEGAGDQQFTLGAMTQLCAVAKNLAPNFTAQGVGMVLWACTATRYYDESLADVLLGVTADMDAEKVQPENLSQIMTFAARFGYGKRVLARFVRHFIDKQHEFPPMQLATCIWSASVLGVFTPDAFSQTRQLLADAPDAFWADAETRRQLFHAFLLTEGKYDGSPLLAPARLAACRDDWRDYAHVSSPSKTQLKICELVRELMYERVVPGCRVELEYIGEGGLFSVDVAILFPAATSAKKFALEVNGPHHYCINCKRKLLTNIARFHLLQQRGWVTLQVPFWEWHEMFVLENGREAAFRAYLTGKLERAGVFVEASRVAGLMADGDVAAWREGDVAVGHAETPRGGGGAITRDVGTSDVAGVSTGLVEEWWGGRMRGGRWRGGGGVGGHWGERNSGG